MKTADNEILVYYNAKSSRGKKVLALARTMAANVKEVEYHKSPFTPTIWRRVLDMLALRPKDMLNRAAPYYQDNIRGRDFDDEGWLNILVRNPDLLIAPIVIQGKRAVLCNNPTDIYQLNNKQIKSIVV